MKPQAIEKYKIMFDKRKMNIFIINRKVKNILIVINLIIIKIISLIVIHLFNFEVL